MSRKVQTLWGISMLLGCFMIQFQINAQVCGTPLTSSLNAITVASTNKIYSVNVVTGKATLVTTSNLVTTSINSLASNAEDGIIYYVKEETANTNRAVYGYNIKTNTHFTVIADVTTLGVTLGANGVGSGAASFSNGKLYLGIEGDNASTTDFDRVWELPLNALGTASSGAAVLKYRTASITASHDWGDFIVDGNILYDSYSNTPNATWKRIDMDVSSPTGSVLAMATNTQYSQIARDAAGNFINLKGVQLQSLNATNGTLGALVNITTDGTTALPSGITDAADCFPTFDTLVGAVYLRCGGGLFPAPSLPISLYDDLNNNTVVNSGETLLSSAIATDAFGNYKITGLIPGGYVTRVPATFVKDGITYTLSGAVDKGTAIIRGNFTTKANDIIYDAPTGTNCGQTCSGGAQGPNLFTSANNGTFGAGTPKQGSALSAGITTYTFANLGCSSPTDGSYTIANSTNCGTSPTQTKIFNAWDIISDHTGNTGGYMMIVNANVNANIAFTETITGLCPNTDYTFSAWVYNLCNCTIKPNLAFLVNGNTAYISGDVAYTGAWKQLGFTFNSGANTSAVLAIRNSNPGGGGNDWVIDDIEVSLCGPQAIVAPTPTSLNLCTGQNASFSANISDPKNQFRFYIWQQSTDNGLTWTNIGSVQSVPAATTPPLNYMSSLPINNVTASMNGYKYRMQMATAAVSIGTSCAANSDELPIYVQDYPASGPTVISPVNYCLNNTATPLSATPLAGNTLLWWGTNMTGGTSSTTVPTPSTSTVGTTTYYVSQKTSNGCESIRTPIVVNVYAYPSAPTINNVAYCQNATPNILTATATSGGTLLWWGTNATGGTSSVIAPTPSTSSTGTTSYYVSQTVNGCESPRAKIDVVVNARPSGSIIVTNTLCPTSTDGSINLTPAGGLPNYTYVWNNAATTEDLSNLATGSYSVVITDARSCTTTVSATVVAAPDVTLPTIACPSDITTYANVACNLTQNFTAPTGIDNCPGATTTQVAGLPSGSIFPTGVTFNTFKVTDAANNMAFCSFKITVLDTIKPNIICPANINQGNSNNICGANINYTLPMATDNCNVANPVNQNFESGLRATEQAKCWLFSATDISAATVISGAYSMRTGQLSGTPMSVTSPWVQLVGSGNLTFSHRLDLNNGTTRDLKIYLIDQSNVATLINTYNYVIASGTTVVNASVPITQTGLYRVKFEFSGTGGNSRGVLDNISIPGNFATDITTCTAAIYPNIFQSDNTGLLSGSTFPVGVTTLQYTAKDPSGNTKTCSFTITINDTQAPTITCPTNIVLPRDAGVCDYGTATYGQPTVTDNCGFAAVTQTGGLPSGSTFPVGTTIISFESIDNAGNTSTCSFNVTINGGTPLSATATSTNIACAGGTTGSISVVPTGGAAPLQYSIDGVNFQNSPTFLGLSVGIYAITVKDVQNCVFSFSQAIIEPLPVVATISKVEPLCAGSNNGSISIVAADGNPPYQYSKDGGSTWQSGSTFTGLSAGTYSVKVRDATNCIFTQNTVLIDPIALTFTQNTVNVSCLGGNNGKITLTPSGGNPIYEYSKDGGITWTLNNVFENLTASTYDLKVRDVNGCIATGSATLTQPSTAITFTDSLGFASATCTNDGLIKFKNVAGGTAPYLYSLDGGATTQSSPFFMNLTSGTYQLAVIDANGCSTLLNESLPPVDLVFNVMSVTHITCFGQTNGAFTLFLSGGTPPYQYSKDGGVTYQSSPTFTTLAGGTYQVSGKDALGCVFMTSVTINEPPILTATAVQDSVLCNGQNNGVLIVTSLGGTAPFQYSKDNGTNYQASQIFENLTAGTYNLTVKDANNCLFNFTKTVLQPALLTATAVTDSVNCHGGNDGFFTLNAMGGTATYEYSLDGINFQKNPTFLGLSAGTFNATIRDMNGCLSTLNSILIEEPTAITGSTTSINVLCNASSTGSVILTALGGTPNLLYSKDAGTTFQNSNTFNGLTAGTHSFTVKDFHECEFFLIANITEPSQLLVSTNGQNVVCFGTNNGQITAFPNNGGIRPYKYSLDNVTFQSDSIFSGLGAGTYTLTIKDANNCTAQSTEIITEPTAIIASVVVQNTLCDGSNDGTVTVMASGGTSPYLYSKDGINFGASNVFNGLSAGLNVFTIRDAQGCQKTVTANITQPLILSATTTKTDVLCHGLNTGSIALTAIGGTSPYMYSADNGTNYQTSATFNGLTAGNYLLKIKDANGCLFSFGESIGQPSALLLSPISKNISCFTGNDGQITLNATGGTAPLQYSKDAGINYQNTPIFANLTVGTYNVVVKDANNCTTTQSITLTQPASLVTFTDSLGYATASCAADGFIKFKNVVGGVSPYEYSINGGAYYQSSPLFTGLTGGNYNLVVRDANGCTTVLSETLPPVSIMVSTVSTTNVLCNGALTGAFQMAASGGVSPYLYSIDNGVSYQSSPTFSGLPAGIYQIKAKDALGCSFLTGVTITQPLPLVLTLSTTAVLCNGQMNGQIIAIPSGGTSAFQYSLNGAAFQSPNVFNGLGAAAYSVALQDANGCMTLATTTISAPANLSATAASTNPLCIGSATGNISVSAFGGTMPYDYSNDNGSTWQGVNLFQNLTAGTYTLMVRDANNCTVSLSKTLTNPLALTASATTVAVKCHGGNDGKITITATGGTPNYQYSLDNGANWQTSNQFMALPSGLFSYTVRDANGCLVVDTLRVTQPKNPVTFATEIGYATATCLGDGFIRFVNVLGGTPTYQFSIDGGAVFQNPALFPNLSGGIYPLVVRDALGCLYEKSDTLPPVGISVSITNKSDVSCFGGNNGTFTLVAMGGIAPYQYSKDNGISYQSSPIFTGLTAGIYQIVVKDNLNCEFHTNISIIEPALLTTSNSVSGRTCDGDNRAIISLTVNGGTLPYTFAWTGGATTQNLENITAGNYNVTVTDAKNCMTNTTVTVINQVSPLLLATNTNAFCATANGTINLTATSSGSVTYAWSNGVTIEDPTGLAPGTYTVTATDNFGCTSTITTTINITLSPVASISAANSTCGNANGNVILSVADGQMPYTYLWSNAATSQNLTNVAAAAYRVTLTDNQGCTAVAATVVNNIPGPALTVTGLDGKCGVANGGVTTFLVGGTAPFTYLWSNGATTPNIANLAAGTYNVTVTDANNCTATASTTIGNATSPTASIASNTPSTCGLPNGVLNVNVAGGTAPIVFTWSNGQSNQNATALPSGSYTITLSDLNGCTTMVSGTISSFPSPVISVAPISSTCGNANGNLNLTVASSSTTLTFLWSNMTTNQNLSNVLAGIYTVTATDLNNCTTTAFDTIFNIAGPLPSISAVADSCGLAKGKAHVDLSGGTPPFTYLWSNGGTTADKINLAAGTYLVSVTDANGCTAVDTATIILIPKPSISGVVINESCSRGNGTITVSVTAGGAPYQFLWSDGAIIKDRSNLAAGTYSVTVTDVHGCKENYTFTVVDDVLACPDDWGDLPNLSSGGGNYITTLSVDGPRHSVIAGLKIGAKIDDETDGNPSPTATGDDGAGDFDDDDGLGIFARIDWKPGLTVRIPLETVNTTGQLAYFEAWIDWNGDGDFDDTGEMIADLAGSNMALNTTLVITAPTDMVLDKNIGARFRYSKTDNMTPLGKVYSGEVEDYLIRSTCAPVCSPTSATKL
jgi:hypothetical protein